MSKRFQILTIGAVLLLPFAPARLTAQEAPAAIVVKIQGGDVSIRSGGVTTAAEVGARLAVGDEVVPAPGARAYLVHRSGQTQVIAEATRIADLPGAAAEGDMFARTVRVLAQAANSDARTQPNRQGMIRPIPGEPVLVSPRNGIKVNGVRPTFHWMAVEGATAYTLQLRADGERPRRYQVDDDNQWTLPESEAPLTPGTTYRWTVAPTGGRPTREEPFSVLGEAERQQLESGIEAISGMGLDPLSDGRMLAAVVFTDLGLYYDAVAAIAELEQAGDPLGADLYLLKGEVLDRLGRLDEAREAFDRADALLRG
jgi:hypothetical protein